MKPKVVILAGGLGSRLSEETHLKPKPMVEIGGKPILWHIMKIYSHYGFNEFVICLGYKGEYIKEWFNNYYLYKNDVTFDLGKNEIEYHKNNSENWKVTLVDTGQNSMTGGRIKRVKEYLNDQTFMLTYGDGVADINIKELYEFHKSHKKPATVTAIKPKGRFGALSINEKNEVFHFGEKIDNQNARINGGFFILEPKVFDYIKDDSTIFEHDPLEKLTENQELSAYHHQGFWHAMDKLSDKNHLDQLWNENKAPWKIWEERQAAGIKSAINKENAKLL